MPFDAAADEALRGWVEPTPGEPSLLGDEETDDRRARTGVRRRTALLVAVPVVLALGLAVVALTQRGDGTSPAVPPQQASGDGQGSAGGPAPAATGLDADLEARFAAAVEGAAADGVPLTLTSGWRSAEDQAGLVESALEKYGSAEEAHRWVLPPETSAHVAGLAIDVGPTDGALWLEANGAAYGLCRVYANEVWHFEPVIDAGGTCPDLLPDSSSGWDGVDS